MLSSRPRWYSPVRASMDEQETDLNLVKRARNGDRDAFRLLVERYQKRIFGHCFGMVRNRDDAMDLTQETFVRIYRNLDHFEGSSQFYTWTYRIATNVCIDFLRRARRSREVDYDDTVRHEHEESSENDLMGSPLGINPARLLARKELMDKINDALGTLSDAHRQILIMREFDNLSYEEMAETLGISIGTVMSRLHHARKNMQKALQEYLAGSLDIGS